MTLFSYPFLVSCLYNLASFFTAGRYTFSSNPFVTTTCTMLGTCPQNVVESKMPPTDAHQDTVSEQNSLCSGSMKPLALSEYTMKMSVRNIIIKHARFEATDNNIFNLVGKWYYTRPVTLEQCFSKLFRDIIYCD